MGIACVASTVGVFALCGEARADQTEQIYYFKHAREVPLDVSRVAVKRLENGEARGGRTPAVYTERATDFQYPLAQWTLYRAPATPGVGADVTTVRAVVSDAAASGSFDFVSPVFTDDFGGPMVVTPTLLMAVNPSVPVAEARAIACGYGTILEEGFAGEPNGFRVGLATANGYDVLRDAAELSRRDDVLFAEPDMIFTGRAELIPNDTNWSSMWGLRNIGQFSGVAGRDVGAWRAWDITTGSPSIFTVIIDVGVDLAHPDLNLGPSHVDLTGQGSGGNPFNNCDSHGTAVASCVSAKINNALGVVGVAPATRSASARTFVSNSPTCDGSWTTQISWTPDAISFAQGIGARVTNNSNGYGFTSASIDSAYQNSYNAGIVHFASSGNNAGAVLYPASIPIVNALSAMMPNGTLASFSNFGPETDFTAPGTSIMACDRVGAPGYSTTNYATVQGTSFASPYAAGVAALIFSLKPTLTPAQVESFMRTSAIDLGVAGFDNSFGNGLVNAWNAFQQVGCTPVFDQQPPATIDRPCPGAQFSISSGTASTAPGTVTLRWRRNGVSLTNGADYANTTTSALTIKGFGPSDVATYTLAATNACGTTISSAVIVTNYCPADLLCDGQVDDGDFVRFATAYDLLLCSDPNMTIGCPADLNVDGQVDDIDFVAFATAYDILLCP